MRFTRSLMMLLAIAFAAAGCALMEPEGTPVANAPAPASVDNVAYGGDTTGAIAAPASYVGRGLFTDLFAPTPQVMMMSAAPAPAARQESHSSFFGGPGPSATMVAETAPVATQESHSSFFGGPGPSAPAAAAPVAYAPTPAGPYTLDSGDRLRIVVFGQDGLSNAYVIDAGGNIAMPLIGSVKARGTTTEQLTKRIVAKLKQGFVRDPRVAVEIEAYRPFFILGEVTAPGQYPYIANMTVETAVAIAGGFGPRAFRRTVTLSRVIDGQQMRMTVPITYAVRPGDTLNIEERWF
jgi:polysaccharide biosynthesis/export protein